MQIRNQVMRHAFENLPQTVLGTEVGRLVYRVLQRQVNNLKGNRKQVRK